MINSAGIAGTKVWFPTIVCKLKLLFVLNLSNNLKVHNQYTAVSISVQIGNEVFEMVS